MFSTIEYRPPAISEGTISNGIVVQVLDVSDPDEFGVTVTSTLEPNIPSGAIYPEQQEDQVCVCLFVCLFTCLVHV